MLVRCPHCGKAQMLSPAELSACGNRVICPQCVSEFKVSEVVEEESREMVESPRAATAGISFCPHCGQHLPASGLRFCPYCGHSLALAAEPQLSASQSVSSCPEPVVVSKPTAEEKPVVVNRRLADMPYIAPMGNKRHHISDVEASPRFKAVSYVIIAVLAMVGFTLLYLINK